MNFINYLTSIWIGLEAGMCNREGKQAVNNRKMEDVSHTIRSKESITTNHQHYLKSLKEGQYKILKTTGMKDRGPNTTIKRRLMISNITSESTNKIEYLGLTKIS